MKAQISSFLWFCFQSRFRLSSNGARLRDHFVEQQLFEIQLRHEQVAGSTPMQTVTDSPPCEHICPQMAIPPAIVPWFDNNILKFKWDNPFNQSLMMILSYIWFMFIQDARQKSTIPRYDLISTGWASPEVCCRSWKGLFRWEIHQLPASMPSTSHWRIPSCALQGQSPRSFPSPGCFLGTNIYMNSEWMKFA